jgi:hypothetical protein
MSASFTFFLLFALAYLVAPVTLVWGWMKWFGQPKLRTVTSILALCGFVLASASALLAVSTIACALVVGGFRYYDPALMRIFGIGALLSLAASVSGFGGIWKASSLRWHSPVAGLATLAFWVVSMAGE